MVADNEFEHVIGSLSDTERLEFADGPKNGDGITHFVCNEGLSCVPKHQRLLEQNKTLYWCQKCGLPLSLVQVDRYYLSPEYIKIDEADKIEYERKKKIFEGDPNDQTHIERKDGVNIISYDKDKS